MLIQASPPCASSLFTWRSKMRESRLDCRLINDFLNVITFVRRCFRVGPFPTPCKYIVTFLKYSQTAKCHPDQQIPSMKRLLFFFFTSSYVVFHGWSRVSVPMRVVFFPQSKNHGVSSVCARLWSRCAAQNKVRIVKSHTQAYTLPQLHWHAVLSVMTTLRGRASQVRNRI